MECWASISRYLIHPTNLACCADIIKKGPSSPAWVVMQNYSGTHYDPKIHAGTCWGALIREGSSCRLLCEE